MLFRRDELSFAPKNSKSSRIPGASVRHCDPEIKTQTQHSWAAVRQELVGLPLVFDPTNV